jgi:DNA-directed RNA polymerase subunit RPC12/RpoP
MRYMENSPFAQEGKAVTCKYCGGVVIITYRETRDDSLNGSDRERGI